ncbi:C2H2 type zinc-finger-domain-containing protein, partial [Dissophora ornata]
MPLYKVQQLLFKAQPLAQQKRDPGILTVLQLLLIGQATTCLTCGIRLPSLETQQQHHKSDWHTYNLKRKMVYLPPVSSEVFAQLVTASREQANPEEVEQPECVPCGKKYLSFQAYDNHLNSKKHKLTVVAYEKKQQKKEAGPTDDDATSGATTESTTAPVSKEVIEQLDPSETVCLFCSHEATDAAKNYEHMRSTHGFFLPSFERLIDLPGMLTYLADKLVENHDCLWCTPSVFSQNLRPDQELNAGFATLASVRRHMNDKGHCKLAMDQGAEREYADFY